MLENKRLKETTKETMEPQFLTMLLCCEESNLCQYVKGLNHYSYHEIVVVVKIYVVL